CELSKVYKCQDLVEESRLLTRKLHNIMENDATIRDLVYDTLYRVALKLLWDLSFLCKVSITFRNILKQFGTWQKHLPLSSTVQNLKIARPVPKVMIQNSQSQADKT